VALKPVALQGLRKQVCRERGEGLVPHEDAPLPPLSQPVQSGARTKDRISQRVAER
jgi:hypothetical protein